MTAPRGTGWLSRLIVAQVYLVTGGSVYVVTEARRRSRISLSWWPTATGAELQLAFPTFTEAVCMAAQKICRTLGIGSFPQVWSYLGPED